MKHWFYCYLLSPLVYLLASPFLILHPKMREGKLQRLGHYSVDTQKQINELPTKRIWFHGASMGDLLALKPTIEAFHKAQPDVGIVVSAMTNSGYNYGLKQLSQFGPVIYIPYDLRGAVKRSLALINPQILVVEYTELWPILVTTAKEQGVKVVLHNGRISEKTAAYYRYLFRLTGNLLAELDLLLMRDHDQAERAIKGGAAGELVKVTGNTKYDNLLPGLEKAKSRQLFKNIKRGQLLVFGSIHQPEFLPLISMYAELLLEQQNLALAIAPRYLEQVDEIKTLAEKMGLLVTLRSQGGSPNAGQLFIVDTMGELMDLYWAADVAVVGGTFCNRGGQNILEPAICGKPVFYGPSTANFSVEVALLNGHGGQQVASVTELKPLLKELLNDPEKMVRQGGEAYQTVAAISGAARENSRLLEQLILATA